MSERRSKRKEVPSSECDAEDRSAAYDTQSTKKTRKREANEQKNEGTARATSRDGKRKMDKDRTREDECEELKADEASTPEGRKKRVRTTGLVNHRINNALLERARLIERDVLPAVDLHYVIDRRLNKTDIEWKLRSTAIGLVVQCPYGLGEEHRQKLLDDVRSRILSQSKDKKQRTTLSVLKKANLVEMRAKFGSMRYTLMKAVDGESYMVLGNLPGHKEVADKLAELKARIVPLLVHFKVELKELKEIVSQSLRGRIFTNKDAVHQDGCITARIDLRVRQFTNLEKLRSDRGLMITLIHELAHAITPTDVKQIKGRGKVKVSHGPLFWENVMKIAKTASEIEHPARAEGGSEGTGETTNTIFELTDELEFRNKIEKEDSLWDEADDDNEVTKDDVATPAEQDPQGARGADDVKRDEEGHGESVPPLPVVMVEVAAS